MKLLSTLAVLALLLSVPAIAAETAPQAESPNPAVEETPFTPMNQSQAAAEVDLADLLLDESRLRFCFPGEPEYCESEADCPPWCYCHTIGNCCE